jgi:hypothetical protein
MQVIWVSVYHSEIVSSTSAFIKGNFLKEKNK